MKNRITFTLALLFALTLNVANAQNLDEILEEHFEAVGQEELLEKETYVISATASQMGVQFPMVMKMERPNKFRVELEMQGQKMIQVFDGEQGWVLAPWLSSEAQPLEGMQLQQATAQVNIDGDLYNYEEKGFDVELIGEVMSDGKEAYRIKLTNEDGAIYNYYLDADTYLISKVTSTVSAQGQQLEVEQRMSDYKNIDGVMIATRIESQTPMGTSAITINDISFDEDLGEDTFAKP